MSENEDVRSEEIPQEDTAAMVGLLRKILYKLDAIEKGIGALAGRSNDRPAYDKPFKKPYKEYGRPYRPKERARGRDKEDFSNEGKFYHGIPFGKKKHGGKGDFKKDKKHFKKASKAGRKDFGR